MGYNIAVIFAAILAFQYVNAKAVQSERGTVDVLLHEIEDAITDLTLKLRVAITGIKDKAATVVQNATKQLNEVLDPLSEKIFELVNKAADKGIDVAECTTNKLDELKRIPTEAAQSITQCIKPNLDGAKEIVNKTTNLINVCAEQLRDLTIELENCASNPFCVSHVGNEAGILSAKVAEQALPLVVGVTAEVTKYGVQITNCGATEVRDATLEIDKKAGDIIKCIKDISELLL